MPAPHRDERYPQSLRPIPAFFVLVMLAVATVAFLAMPPASGGDPPPVVADTDPPVGGIDGPLPGRCVTDRSIYVSVWFMDRDGIDESSISLAVDGAPLWPTTYPSDANWTDVRVRGYGNWVVDGPHTAEARAADRLGNGPRVLNWSFSVDASPPVVTVTAPVGNPLVEDGSVTLEWTGTDDASGVDHYLIRLDDGPYIDVRRATSFPFRGLPPGMHYFYIVAYDVAGNSNGYYYGGVAAVATVPTPPPTVTPPANLTTQVTVVVPDQVPAWAVPLVAITAAEAVAIAGLALRGRAKRLGGGKPGP